MKRLLIIVVNIISVSWLFGQPKEQRPARAEQDIYAYQCQSIGYSDIKNLYPNNSTKSRQPFFRNRLLQKITVDFSCSIKKIIVSNSAVENTVAYQVINPIITIENGGFPVNTERVSLELLHTVIATIEKSGSITSVRIDSTISNLSANMLKEVVSRMQFIILGKNTSSWQIPEENTSGLFLAKYRLLKKDSMGTEYRKTNMGYLKTKFHEKEQRIITDNQTNMVVDASGKLKKMTVSEAQAVVFNSDTITASGSSIHIQLQSTSKVETAELAYLKSLSQSPAYHKNTALSAGLSADQINRAAYTNTLGGNNWNTLMNQLPAVAFSSNATKKDSLVLQFRALAYLYPETCMNFYSVLKATSYHSFTYQVLTQALATTETPAAINALTHIIEYRKREENILLDLLPVLATTASPTDEAVNLVKEMAFDTTNNKAVVSTSQLALGGIAFHFKKQDVNKSEAISLYIINHLKNERDTIQKILVLGNTGSPMVLPIFKSYICSNKTSDRLKITAIEALRLINNKEAISLLKELQKSTNVMVANASKEVIHFKDEYMAE